MKFATAQQLKAFLTGGNVLTEFLQKLRIKNQAKTTGAMHNERLSKEKARNQKPNEFLRASGTFNDVVPIIY
jgi:hypothetical protein